jgi:hypothetical protein
MVISIAMLVYQRVPCIILSHFAYYQLCIKETPSEPAVKTVCQDKCSIKYRLLYQLCGLV